MRLPRLRALDDLPAEVQAEEDGDVDVRDEEVGRVEREEDGEAVDEDEERRPEDAPDAQPRLQRAVVRVLLPVEALCFLAAVCLERGKGSRVGQ